MKLTNRDFAAKGRGAAQTCGLFLFCGDEAQAAAAARDLAAWLPDAGERVELTGAELRADPARLGDEARSTSLFGDARHIWVRAAGDEAHGALETLIATAEAGAGAACPVIVVASAASDKSRTAKLLEKRKDALVAFFYPPDLPNAAQQVRAMADAAGLRIGGDIAERIARAANLDVRVAASEIAKLALYLDASPQGPRPAGHEDLDAIGAVSEDDSFAPLVAAVLSGDGARLPAELARMRQMNLNPVGVLLAVERRAAQLARLSAALGARRLGELDRGEKARLGVFWKDEREIGEQLARWPAGKLDRLVPRLMELHRALLTNSAASDLLLGEGLTRITRFAGARR